MQKETRMVVVENFGSCNMRCTYCFPEHMWQREGHQGAMSEETYRGVLEKTFSTSSSDSIDVHIAGGEPLLVGREWLEMAFAAGREIAARHGRAVTFSLQTNATLVTPEMAEFLVGNDVTVGVSLDGEREINEAMRGDTDRTLAGFHLLREATGRCPGVIVTVTNCNARRMREVVAYLDELGVPLFRANQMGATASWNAHAAPRAEDWAAARQDVCAAIARRRGRIMEVNLASSVVKFVRSLLEEGASPFSVAGGCCDMRCPAGRQLMYFDQKGNAYPCPRANVTPSARIGHYAADDFEERWDETNLLLDGAMSVPDECLRCPAQIICDYGCHAFNVAQGNFFEVNCDATKDYFAWAQAHLEDVAAVFLMIMWREHLKVTDDFVTLQKGLDVPPQDVAGLAEELRRALAARRSRADLRPELLQRRYGWHDERVPLVAIDRARVSERPGRA